MTINKQNILAKDCNAVESGVFTKEDCLSQFKDVFSVEGELEGQLHLENGQTLQAVKVPTSRLPISVKEPLKNELDRLIQKASNSLDFSNHSDHKKRWPHYCSKATESGASQQPVSLTMQGFACSQH